MMGIRSRVRLGSDHDDRNAF
uniref:Uncharacterized protein n=1 Tax=Arundo donax TaxID=35708 RepID=A0A0A8ZNQ0_ARUDO